MAASLLRQVWSHNGLGKAWRVIQENARSSQSEEVKNEVARYAEKESTNIRSLSSRLQRGSFAWPKAKGIPIVKAKKAGQSGPAKIRPIVLAPLEARIVQRSTLDALVQVPLLRPYFDNPYSFGGLKRQGADEFAAVPAAVKAVLSAIENGGAFIVCADITGFFTRIPKANVVKIVTEATRDDDFMQHFGNAIRVELSNMAELRGRSSEFPIGEIGVAQGNSLSPLIGNILLHKFDSYMNDGDCRCVRYIDDFTIIAPTRQAAAARLKRARTILSEFGMELAADKTHLEPVSVDSKFEFLGIEFCNGLLRPSQAAQSRLLSSVKSVFQDSRRRFIDFRKGASFPKSASLLSTLKRADGIIQGWGKHYFFCNDIMSFKMIDREVDSIIRGYLGMYADEKSRSDPSSRRTMLGVESLGAIKLRPFPWPSRTGRVARIATTDLSRDFELTGELSHSAA
jgi:retron-type reverse transcriptase